MEKRIIIIVALLVYNIGFSQQIGDGLAPGTSTYLGAINSGVYSGFNAIGGIPDTSYSWSHLFVIRHGNPNNLFQLQLSSSYTENDRLFFRKTNDGNNPTWNEVATRGANTFNGSQIITGNLILGQQGEISTISGPASSGAIQIKTNVNYGGASNRYLRLGWKDNNAFFNPVLSINDDLNVGIGTINPANKLDVNGTIHSKEVKVDMNGWSDFVFKKDYVLPTLQEVEKQIAEKGHLENIPSEEEVLKNGINLGEMNSKLLQKIEELTLYLIEIKKENMELKNQNENFKVVFERLSKIEEKLK
ncbi:hypothetical protein EYY60_02810 [Flavobacterium zhairuonense]|uniref:hypothetical protein n=1 Tax=Flavobacterium zhairuonense TaxID=2493631 RepID=UPI00104BB144|nr:hypothetical protein [Flavobacterium zhairuonense]KAF2515006.1 hypothetical protein EYY60_02810 [Flavobacterium zhairuonense]